MQKSLMIIVSIASIGATGFLMHRMDEQSGSRQYEQTQASCIYNGHSYPEGTIIEGRICKNGKWT
jgi:hypothetical protein